MPDRTDENRDEGRAFFLAMLEENVHPWTTDRVLRGLDRDGEEA